MIKRVKAPVATRDFHRRAKLLTRLSYVWDYDIDEETFRTILAGQVALGRLDRDWAAVRLIEFAPYREIVRLLGFRALLDGWPRWRDRIRSPGRRRGVDFLAWYLPERRPDLLVER